MHNVYAFLIFSFGLAFVSFIGYLSWFSPQGYAKLLVIWKEWIKATSIIYPESYINFFLSPSGPGLWIIRITVVLAFLFSLRGVVFGIWGI